MCCLIIWSIKEDKRKRKAKKKKKKRERSWAIIPKDRNVGINHQNIADKSSIEVDRHNNSIDILNCRFFIIFSHISPIFQRNYDIRPIFLDISEIFDHVMEIFSISLKIQLGRWAWAWWEVWLFQIMCDLYQELGATSLNYRIAFFPLPMWDWFSNLNRKTTFKGAYWRIELLTLMMGWLSSTIRRNVIFPINANQIMYIFYIRYIIN